jgi:hypothetical protein
MLFPNVFIFNELQLFEVRGKPVGGTFKNCLWAVGKNVGLRLTKFNVDGSGPDDCFTTVR